MNRNDKAFPFDRIAQTYSQFRYPNEKLVEHIFNRVRYADNILEAGCGPADYLSILSELLNARGYGFDISQNMIKEARQKNPSLE
ncbi:MAG TPA: class I SAM-dependent methyltransferase, partial [Mesotoga sp.]|nr:class I SAM-dependent methyltransferase [Mesotoga sp.]